MDMLKASWFRIVKSLLVLYCVFLLLNVFVGFNIVEYVRDILNREPMPMVWVPISDYNEMDLQAVEAAHEQVLLLLDYQYEREITEFTATILACFTSVAVGLYSAADDECDSFTYRTDGSYGIRVYTLDELDGSYEANQSQTVGPLGLYVNMSSVGGLFSLEEGTTAVCINEGIYPVVIADPRGRSLLTSEHIESCNARFRQLDCLLSGIRLSARIFSDSLRDECSSRMIRER